MTSVGDSMEKLVTDSGVLYKEHCGDLYKDDSKLELIDFGEEGRVYRDGDTAVKIYHKCPNKDVLDDEEIRQLSDIDTQRVVLPDEAVNGDKVRGYTMPYIEGDSESIFDMNKDVLVSELGLLEDDLKLLGEEKVLIGDLRESNYLSTEDYFYLIDSGDYQVIDSKCSKANLEMFYEFFIQDVFGLYLLDSGDMSKVFTIYSNIKKDFYNYNGGLAEYVNDTFSGSIHEEVKKLVK